MPTGHVTKTARCPYCLRASVVATVEQLLNVHGDVVAGTELERGKCTISGCIGPRVTRRYPRRWPQGWVGLVPPDEWRAHGPRGHRQGRTLGQTCQP
ncbi:MAG: hypothetical protein EHM63_02160 [Actinobacteria bacterium]|nr:MAG: hypothetical protein EHM63_02160 [Actinomycetota bacterium]